MIKKSTSRRVGRFAAVAGAAGAAIALMATPAFASGPHISSHSGGANIRSCPNLGCTSYGWWGNGTSVTMVCWIDAQWVSPPSSNYTSNRWFYVNSPHGGYIHSSLVSNQVSTPHC